MFDGSGGLHGEVGENGREGQTGTREVLAAASASPHRQQQAAGDGHDDDHVVETHPFETQAVDRQDLFSHPQQAVPLDSTASSDPRNENAVCAIDAVALPDVETQRLAGSLVDLNGFNGGVVDEGFDALDSHVHQCRGPAQPSGRVRERLRVRGGWLAGRLRPVTPKLILML